MLFLILAILSSASMTLVLKLFRQQKGNRYGILLGNYLTCIVIAFLLLPDRGQILHGHGKTLLLGIVGGVLFVLALVFMQSSVRTNGASLTAAFAKLGLLVSLFVSIVFFSERPGIIHLIGILFVIAAFILLYTEQSESRDQSGKKTVIVLFLTMLANGGGDAMAKVFQQIGAAGEENLYFFWLFCASFLLTLALSVAEWKNRQKRILIREAAAGVIVGIPNYFSSVLLLYALKQLPSFVVFPVYSTGAILVVLLLSVILFRERLQKKQIIGIGLILAALLLLNL